MFIELQTPDSTEYQFHPVGDVIVNFKVRVGNDAHVALTMQPRESTDSMIKVIIGGWGNSKSAIRKNHRNSENAVEIDTPGILNADEFRGFWIRWYNAVITVGREGETQAFMLYEDPSPIPINYIGVSTPYGAGSWILEASISGSTKTQRSINATTNNRPCFWVTARNGHVPPEAMLGGYDGEQLYIARARHASTLTPGKLVPSHGVAYVGWDGREHPYDEYEVLCGGNDRWLSVSGGNIPPHAMVSGQSEHAEPLFVGRAIHNGTMKTGKVHPSHGCLYLPYDGREVGCSDYEILIS